MVIIFYLLIFRGFTATDQLALSNILDIKSNKFSYLSNLNLDADPLLIAEELSYLKEFNCEIIVIIKFFKKLFFKNESIN